METNCKKQTGDSRVNGDRGQARLAGKGITGLLRLIPSNGVGTWDEKASATRRKHLRKLFPLLVFG